MIATSAPTAVPTSGSGAYPDNYGKDPSPTGKNGLFLFTRFLLQLRKAHPCLRHALFGDLDLDQGNDVTYWFKSEDGVSDFKSDARCLHWRIDGSAIGDHDFLLCVNSGVDKVLFAVPPPRWGRRWRRLIDTASWAETVGNFWTVDRADIMEGNYRVNPHSVVVLIEF
jgi:glycogen operon protein